MQITDPTQYTDVSQADFDRFKTIAKTHGMNISGNSDNVEFDKIPVHIEFKPDARTLDFTITEPHWLAPGVTAGAIHRIVAQAMNFDETSVRDENPQVSHQHDVHQKQTTIAAKESPHPTQVTRATHGK